MVSKACQLRANQVIETFSMPAPCNGMQYHAGNGGFAVAAANNHTLVYPSIVRKYNRGYEYIFIAQFLCLKQLGVINPGVHP
jgi:hypothetical protein